MPLFAVSRVFIFLFIYILTHSAVLVKVERAYLMAEFPHAAYFEGSRWLDVVHLEVDGIAVDLREREALD